MRNSWARLRHKLNQHTIPLQFRTDPTGRFDMALVPVYRDNTWHFVLAIEEGLSTQDQVALYAHAIAHLLHNNQQKQAGKRLLLYPSDHRTHTDMLMGLRYLESDDHRSRLDPLQPHLIDTILLFVDCEIVLFCKKSAFKLINEEHHFCY